jgi:glycosyltransferase involved in cell wall biosynthesis
MLPGSRTCRVSQCELGGDGNGWRSKLYADRYPDFPASRIQDIPNGFDEDMFTSLAQTELAVTQDPNRRLALLHSGLLYPNERNPEPFFQALAMLRQLGRLDPGRVEFVFLGSGYDELYQPTVDCLGISDFVTFKPSVPYKNALEEMCASDACLLFQGANCNQQIPAKVYEYLYAGKPIFALTDERGDTAQLLESVGVQDIVQMDNANAIADVLPRYLERLASNAVFSPGRQAVGRLSRRSGVAVLARILNQVAT